MSRPTLFAAGCLAAIALAGCQPASEGAATPASSADPAAASSTGAAQGVQVSNAWIRETPPNAAVAGGYLTLRSDVDDRLFAVDTSASAMSSRTRFSTAILLSSTAAISFSRASASAAMSVSLPPLMRPPR